MVLHFRVHGCDHLSDNFLKVRHLRMNLDVSCVQSRHLDGIIDQLAQMLGLAICSSQLFGQHFPGLIEVCEHRRCSRFDERQWSLELVCHSIDQGSAQLLTLSCGCDLLCQILRPCTF